MKKCLQCEQVYGDETNFCLSDGATLVSGSFTSHDETPTVTSNSPFIPSVYSAPTEAKKSSALLIVAVIGLLALLGGGAIVSLVIYGLNSLGKKDPNVSISNEKSNKNVVVEQKSGNDNLAQNLKQQQDKLDKDKQKLEDDRKALEAKKLETQKLEAQNKETSPTPKPPSSSTATVFNPPSNVRESPNGAVLCAVKARTTINILGTTNVYDKNGVWYYTDVCGETGVIHSSQIRF